MKPVERQQIHDKIDQEVEAAKKNIPTPFIGIMDAVWWNGQEGKVIKSRFKMALDSLKESIKYSISDVGR